MGIFDIIHVPAGVFLFTLVETLTMVLWLNFALAHSAVLAFVVLAVGLQIEHAVAWHVGKQS